MPRLALAARRGGGYTAGMRTFSLFPALLLLSFALGAAGGCGPKDIGEGTSDTASEPQGVSTADQLRYPVYGSGRTQRMLYWNSRPDVMANVQQWQRAQMQRAAGQSNALAPAANPEDPQYRAVPRQRSPFRQ